MFSRKWETLSTTELLKNIKQRAEAIEELAKTNLSIKIQSTRRRKTIDTTAIRKALAAFTHCKYLPTLPIAPLEHLFMPILQAFTLVYFYLSPILFLHFFQYGGVYSTFFLPHFVAINI